MNRQKNILVALLWNIFMAYAVLMLCRVIFVVVNYRLYAGSFTDGAIWSMLVGALRFDTAAVCYLNALYVLLLLFPLHYKEGRMMQGVTKVVYLLCNGVGVVANLCDVVYVPFTGRRTTWSLFSEFSNEGNIGKVIGVELLNHWYLLVVGILLMWIMARLYIHARNSRMSLWLYYATRVLLLAMVTPLVIFGIRGGVGRTVRPISLNDANQYINSPSEAAVVLNTPFSMIRTIGKNPFHEVRFFEDAEASEIFNPIHRFSGDGNAVKPNIVVFIVESFGKEYIGAYNGRDKDRTLTPFLDSLISVSHTYTRSFGNGRKSIDGMPSVLSGIPMFVEPFFVTPASLNKVSGIAGELVNIGYHSAFFHGAPNGSMGFQAFARATGFNEYFGMNEYNASPRHNGEDDFDGSWAIWDEPFFEYFAETMDTMSQPFVTALFSASSHHPFAIPKEYADKYKEGELPIYKCIEYTDNALRRFFDKARKSDWFGNTLFVITADHCNQSAEERYQTSSGLFEVPVIFYLPSGNEPFVPAMDSVTVAQQIDIMPTVLDYVGYNRPFLSFGKSLIADTITHNYAVNYSNGIYQYFDGDYMLQFDGNNSVAFVDYANDPLHKKNLKGTMPAMEEQMQRRLKSIIQQYMARMLQDRLVPENDNENR